MNKRRSINIAGFTHGDQPIPAASRISNIIVTGGIYGQDIVSGEVPDDVNQQGKLMFANLEKLLNAGGAGFEDVIKMTFWVKEAEMKSVINEGWLNAFPDSSSRPARHTLINPNLPLNLKIQCDAIAIINDSQ